MLKGQPRIQGKGCLRTKLDFDENPDSVTEKPSGGFTISLPYITNGKVMKIQNEYQ